MKIRNVYTAINEVAKKTDFGFARPHLDRSAVDATWHPAVCGAITTAAVLGHDRLVVELESLLGWIASCDLLEGTAK